MMFSRHDSLYDRQIYFPIGLMTLVGVAEREGYGVSYFDYQLCSSTDLFRTGALRDWLGRQDTPVSRDKIGLGAMSNLLPFAVLSARDLKETYQASILLGGAGPSGVARGIVDSFEWVDAAFTGEAEVSLPAYLSGVPHAPGIASKGHVSPDPKRTFSLDSLPLVPEVVERHYSAEVIADDRTGVSMITSRGCQYKCRFCSIEAGFNSGVTKRSPDNVCEEITRWNRLGKHVILFQDDIFTRSEKRVAALCDRFRRLPFRFLWKCFAHVNHVTPEMLRDMHASGCVQVRYGIESGSNRLLEAIDKQFSIEKALEVVRYSCQIMDSVHVSFIYGFPGETEEEFQQTMAAAEACREMGATILSFMLSPLPGTRLFRETNLRVEYSPELTPEYVNSGHEIVMGAEQIVLPEHQYIFDLVAAHPRVFPGFFHYDYQNSVRSKAKRMHAARLKGFFPKTTARESYRYVDR